MYSTVSAAALARNYPTQGTAAPAPGSSAPVYHDNFGAGREERNAYGAAAISPPTSAAPQPTNFGRAPAYQYEAHVQQQQAPYGQQPPQHFAPQPQYEPYQPYGQQGAYGQQAPVNPPNYWGGGYHGPNTDVESHPHGPLPDDKLITDNLDVTIRHGFVRKVYGILSVQLLVTFGLASIFNFVPAAGEWLIDHAWLGFVAMGVALVIIILLVCVEAVGRKHPWNMLMLMILSCCFGLTIALASVRLKTSSFVIAAGITAGVTIAVSIFACQTRWDFTATDCDLLCISYDYYVMNLSMSRNPLESHRRPAISDASSGCGVFVFVSMIVLVIFGIVTIFVRNQITHIVYAALGALLFSFYLIYDTQQIVGGKHRKYQYSIDDYIFAALTLYLDIINLFMFILSLVAATNE